LFESEIPDHIEGFECSDKDVMETLWPEGTSKAREVFPVSFLSSRLAHIEEQILSRFVYTQSRASQLGLADPLNPGAEPSDKHSRLMAYADGRDRADRDTSSRLSAYLASGVISIRECVREVMKASGRKTVDGGRETGPGRWVQELAWRDFYVHILAAFPR
jgi:deoxyribodipyrimidine photo-lyase